ncbi:MAG: PAS domain S-box protein, partial [Anaerolineales bacterium]|nr:PAS domain S-box protein [Anaerolineales bacterium]
MHSYQVSEERFQRIIENALDGIYQVDTSGLIVFCNNSFAEILGYTKDELLGRSFRTVMDVEDFPNICSRVQRLQGGMPINGEFRLRHKNGNLIDVSIRVVSHDEDGKILITGFITDITNRKQAEEVLRTNEATVWAIFNATDASISMFDSSGTILAINNMTATRLGKSLDELIGTCIYDHFPPDVGKSRKLLIDQVFNSGVGLVFEDIREGTYFENRVAPILDHQGGVTSVVVYANDITNRKQTEIALVESESRYRTLAEAAQDMIFIVNPDDRIEYINHFSAGKLGMQPEEIIGKKRSLIFSKKANDEQLKVLKKVFRTGETNYSEEMIGLQEGKSWWSIWLIPIKDNKGAVMKVMGVARDITSLKQTQDALKKTNEMLEKRVSERTAELVKSQNQLSALTRQIITSQEDERRRLASALHDEVGQALITIKYDLASIVEEFFFDYQQLHQHISRSMKTIDQAMAHIRRLAENLRPPVLDVAGINISLKEHCWDISTRTSLSIDYRGVELPELPEEISICLYRFVQEALTNVLRHAKASSVKV